MRFGNAWVLTASTGNVILFLLLHKKILCYSRATETYVCSTVQWILVNSALPGMRLIHLKDLRLFKKACHLDSKFARPGYQNSWGISLPWVKISGLRLLKQVNWFFAWKQVRECSNTWTGAVKGNLGCFSAFISALWKKMLPFSAWHSTGHLASRVQPHCSSQSCGYISCGHSTSPQSPQ